MISAIAHPTDFSTEGNVAFAHALRLALANRCRLDLLHVRSPRDGDHWSEFPHVRETLVAWGLLAPGASTDDIAAKTGVTVRKVDIREKDAVHGLNQFLLGHRPDLLVMGTHGRDGLNRWLAGSVSESIAQRTHLPTLFIGPEARSFVDCKTGALGLDTILVAVTHEPSPDRALGTLERLTEGLAPTHHFVHVGDAEPKLITSTGEPIIVKRLQGPVVGAILSEAEKVDANLIAMPTAGHHGFLDVLRGSTTEQVLRQSPCPVLALPA